MEEPTIPSGPAKYLISAFAEVPEMILPIGEISYLSYVTGVEEQLPITVNLLAAKGL